MYHRKFFRSLALFVLSWLLVSQVSGVALAGIVHTREDRPSDFNEFLSRCSTTEKRALLEVLGEKIPSSSSEYDSAIRKGLVYRAYNKMTYLFRSDKEVDYHGIVEWAARKHDIDKDTIKRLSTFELERKIAEKNGVYISSTKSMLATGAGVLGAAGAAALGGGGAAGGASAALGGGVAYSMGAGAAGAAGAGAAGTALAATGIGAVVIGILGAGYGIYQSTPDVKEVTAFIVAVNKIKTDKYGDR